MSNVMEYKGYHTRIEFDFESHTLRGKIEGIADFVDFESDQLSEIEKEFHSAVDDYLEFCEEVGKTPDKEYKGTFNIRINPELHKKIAIKAWKDKCSLNSAVERAISEYVDKDESFTISLEESVRDLAKTIWYIGQKTYENETLFQSPVVPPSLRLKHEYSEKEMSS